MNNQNTKKGSEPEVLDDNTVIQIGNKLFACKSIMEVGTEEETQTVLLEGMEGTQYIIQRPDGDIGKSAFLTLSGELISDEGMVVDMMSAGVGSEYNTATQYFEGEDLLTQDMTEDDRRLANALVAVHFQQQQKQQMQSHAHHQDTLQNVTHLENLSNVNYSIQTIPDPDPPPVYPSIQTFKRASQNVKAECVNVKSEYEVEAAASAENAEEFSQNGPKRTLPHKKRKNWEERKHPRKVKQLKKSTSRNKDIARLQESAVNEAVAKMQAVKEALAPAFKCELCNNKFTTQLTFFEHLKTHYEPFKEERIITQQTSAGTTISINLTEQNARQNVTQDVQVIEEFSEPEDLMEGIRGVVEETEAHIDDETQNPMSTSTDEPNLWTLPNNTEQNNLKHSEPVSTVSKEDLRQNETSEPAPTTVKKKKTRSKTMENLVCQQCDRTFHHKNSLVYHMRSHSGERPHQCEICGKSFFAASALKVHKRLHSGDKPYKCEECGRHFRQWGDLKYHSTSLHSEQKQFQCEYCGKDFARKYSLIVHRRIHTGEKNYLCEYCNKTFRASSYLQNHRRIHTGEKPHPCDICGKPFRVRSDMKRHLHTHTRSRNERPASRSLVPKSTESDAQKAANNKARTIQDLVHELKLEVEPNGNVEIVAGPQTPESILPHEGAQTLEYEVTSANDSSNEKDPLESVVRTADEMPYFFI